MDTTMPDYSHEQRLGASQGARIIGIDEAGRGPWAGPVIAAAVWLDPTGLPPELLAGLNDGEKLLRFGLGAASATEIDALNILQATFLAMRRAAEQISLEIDAALIDGNKSPKLPYPCHPLIKGDGKSFSIAAASILAKTHRDRLMVRLATRYPGYGWERNKGYGTRAHQAALVQLGTTPEHRRSFRPIRETLGLSY